MERATAQEKARLADTFVRLCEIESPSGSEGDMAEAVRAELASVGLSVVEDATGDETGAPCGNLVTRIAAPDGARTIMLCAHLDTVPLTAPISVERSDGVFRNRNEGILGADNKAAVAVLIELARRCAHTPVPVGCELLFTTSEEIGLRGAKAFDVGSLEAEFGYAFDHASPIGEVIVAAPSYFRIRADFVGQAAHSGLRPEAGRNAIVAAAKAIERMTLGRLDDQTTANVGVIAGGTATNVVAERCRVEAEVRSLDEVKAAAGVAQMLDLFSWAASATQTDVDTIVEEEFRAYRIPQSDRSLVAAMQALRDCGVEPMLVSTGGGSDAHAFEAKGFRCVNLANGTEANHTPGEQVSVASLETMLDVALRLLERAAEV